MKLISIKCPNCGGNLKLENNKKVINCIYCKTQIFVEDENDNLKKLENERINNYLELASRFFDDKEYEEAYIKYDQVLTLNPNNYEAIFKRGLCITLTSNYLNFEVDSSLNGFNNAIRLLKNSNLENEYIYDIINSYALELLDVIAYIKSYLIGFYEHHLFTKNELFGYINRLYSCLNILEKVYLSVYELSNKVRSKYNSTIYNIIKEIKKSKKYSDLYDVETGNPIIVKYKLTKKENNKLDKKIKNYKKDMLLINNDFKLRYQKLKKQRIIILLIELLLIAITIMMFVKYKNILWNILLILDIILFSFDIFSKELLENNKILLIIKVLIALISIFGYLIS